MIVLADVTIEIVKYINSAGILGVLIAILYGGFKGWWIWGSEYRKIEDERDVWRNLALRGTDLLERGFKIKSKADVNDEETV